MRLAVLDVGSNTVHLLIVDAHYGAAPMPAHSRKMELRLAENLTADGAVTHEAVELLIGFIKESQIVAEDLGAGEISGFATSAIRDAPNGAAVIAEIAEATGVVLELLSGEDEARLTFLAVRRWFGWSSGRLLVLDIGGGSLELATGADEEPDVAISVPLGAGRLTRTYCTDDPVAPKQVRRMRKDARSQIAQVAGRLTRFGEPEVAVATSKTFRQLARVMGAAPSADGPLVRRVIKRDDLAVWLPKLAAMTVAERAALPGVSTGRAGQLLAGAVVTEAAMDLFGLTELVLCPWALREGIILRRLDLMET